MQNTPLTSPNASHTFDTSAVQPTPSRRTVDAPTRAFHALFALSFVGAYVTAEGERLRLLHVTLGYTLAGLLAFRVLYGLVGPRHVRLSLMWRKLQGVSSWLRSAVAPQAAVGTAGVNWRQGQNLLMTLAIAAQLGVAVPLVLSGMGIYQEWGVGLGGDWLEEVHEWFGNLMLAIVLGHVGLVAGLSLWRRTPLAKAMLTGRVSGRGPDLIARNHWGVALALVMAVGAFWTWQWQQSPHGLISVASVSDLWSEHGEEHEGED